MVIEEIVEIVRYLMAQNARHVPGEETSEQPSIDDVWDAIRQVDPVGARVVPPLPSRPSRMYLTITEQPGAVRFRYPCEGRSAGSIPGVTSWVGNKTYTTIMMHGYVGRVMVLVSLVTKDEPYRAHPHKLVGNGCTRGICVVPINLTEEGFEYQFKKVGIQYMKRRDIVESLTDRKRLRVDPFRNNFDHSDQSESIVLSAVRLCFQVFSFGEGEDHRSLMHPVVSDVIHDKKTMGLLHILKTSHCSGTASGRTQVIILCDKVTAEDTEVVFYCEGWEGIASKIMVYRQVAIVFETPAYEDPDTTEHVTVHFQLRRLSDDARSNSLPFEYVPKITGILNKKRKVNNGILQNYIRTNWTPPLHQGNSPSLAQQIWDLEKLHIDQSMTRASHVDQAMPGTRYVELSMPGPSNVDLSMPKPSYVNLAMPGPGHVHLGMPGPSHVDLGMAGPSYVDLTMPGPSHVDLTMPGPSHVDLGMPGPRYVELSMPGPSHVNLSTPEPSHVDHAMLGLGNVDLAVPVPGFNQVEPQDSGPKLVDPATVSSQIKQAVLEPSRRNPFADEK